MGRPRFAPGVFFILAAYLVLAGGCAGKGGRGSAKGKFPDYNVIRIYNDSPEDVFDVELSAGGTETVLDRLPAEHSPVSDRGVSPDPSTVGVSWRTAGGTHHQHDVPIASKLPKGFRGVILIQLKLDGEVNVRFLPYSELR